MRFGGTDWFENAASGLSTDSGSLTTRSRGGSDAAPHWMRPIEEWRRHMSPKQAISEELIDQTLADSFPASDPPAWTLGRERQPEQVQETDSDREKPDQVICNALFGFGR